MIYPYPPLIPEELLIRAKALSVSLLLDGAKAAGITLSGGGCLPPAIQPLDRNQKLAGTALTVRTQPGDNRPIHLAIYGAQKAGYALVIDGRGWDQCAYMGDLMMGACKASPLSAALRKNCSAISGFVARCFFASANKAST